MVSTYYAAQKNLNENIVLPISCTPARKLLVAKYLVRGRVRQRCVGEVYELWEEVYDRIPQEHQNLWQRHAPRKYENSALKMQEFVFQRRKKSNTTI